MRKATLFLVVLLAVNVKRSLIALFVLVAGLTSLAQDKPVAGPFGFERGMTLEQVTKLVGKGTPSVKNPTVVFTFTSAPRPNPAFEKYVPHKRC
jgi:hypothetical protein